MSKNTINPLATMLRGTRPYVPRGWVDGDAPEQNEGARFGALHLSDRYLRAVLRWMPPTEAFANPLEQAGYLRNIGRILSHEGARLLAVLAREGFLSPEQDPVEALNDLLEEVREARARRKG